MESEKKAIMAFPAAVPEIPVAEIDGNLNWGVLRLPAGRDFNGQ
jgi:hypothetical protein